MAPLLEVEDLTFTYRRATRPALRSVSLVVEPGEVLLVAGPSGCGKSTLIRSINGLIPHAYSGTLEGRVRLEGHSVTEMRLREVARYVGTVLQDPARQIVGATVEAELAFGPENLGLPREEIRERIREVLTRARIEHLAGRETSALSGGEQQLVAVAGILMMRPQAYVVDEPLANLDPATASSLLSLLRRMADAGSAIVIVEHRVEEALELRPDRVLYLEEGENRFLGPVDGFLEIADPEAVKLPFEAIVAQARRGRLGPSTVPGPAAAREQAAVSEEVPPRVEFRDVRAGYDGLEVLHGVTASLGAAETVALLGPNGSGKTTLFKTAMKLIPLMGGEVAVDGADTAALRIAQLARTFGYVFQSPSQMFFARTVLEEISYGPRNLGVDPASFEELALAALARVGLDQEDEILTRAPLTLSFGQQKRLAIAIALALHPRTLILDEPSAGQDHRSASRFMDQVRTIPGIESIYLVTHDTDLALTYADRILLFREGQIAADGTPAAISRDLDRWRACNLRETSLMRANAHWPSADGGFADADRLARAIAVSEGSARPSPRA